MGLFPHVHKCISNPFIYHLPHKPGLGQLILPFRGHLESPPMSPAHDGFITGYNGRTCVPFWKTLK